MNYSFGNEIIKQKFQIYISKDTSSLDKTLLDAVVDILVEEGHRSSPSVWRERGERAGSKASFS